MAPAWRPTGHRRQGRPDHDHRDRRRSQRPPRLHDHRGSRGHPVVTQDTGSIASGATKDVDRDRQGRRRQPGLGRFRHLCESSGVGRSAGLDHPSTDAPASRPRRSPASRLVQSRSPPPTELVNGPSHSLSRRHSASLVVGGSLPRSRLGCDPRRHRHGDRCRSNPVSGIRDFAGSTGPGSVTGPSSVRRIVLRARSLTP